jgi:predicted PurR-regulated permease PerM
MDALRRKLIEQDRPEEDAAERVEAATLSAAGANLRQMGHTAEIGIFLLLFGAFLYIGRSIVVPILGAVIAAYAFAPIIRRAHRRGISPWIVAVLIEGCLIAVVALAVTAMAAPLSSWIGRAPEIGAIIHDRLSVLDPVFSAERQLETALFGSTSTVEAGSSAGSMVLPVMAFVTPAAGGVLLFFGALLFLLVGQASLRSHIIRLFVEREAKLRALKIMNEAERNLTGYLTVVTGVNAGLGVVVAAGAWLLGLPNPAVFGLLAALLNYVPYVGPAIMVIALFGVGLVTFPSLGQAMIAPIGMVTLTTIEGHFITPTIIGQRLTLSPLLIVLALAFWTWMWGPIGALLATPLSIILSVIAVNMLPREDLKLPD